MPNVKRLPFCVILNCGLFYHIQFLNFPQWTYGSLPRNDTPCWRGGGIRNRKKDPNTVLEKLASEDFLETCLGPKRKKMTNNLLQDNSPWGTEEIFSSNFMPTNVQSWHKVISWRNVWLWPAVVNICLCPVQKYVEKCACFIFRELKER